MNSIFVMSSPIGGDTPLPLPQPRLLVSQNHRFCPSFCQAPFIYLDFLCTLYWKFPSLVVVVPLPTRQSPETAVLLSHFQLFLLCTIRSIQVSFQQNPLPPQHPAIFTALFLCFCAKPPFGTVSPLLCVRLFLVFTQNAVPRTQHFSLSLCAFVSLWLCVMLFLRL
jgi:hypothetical protein